MGFRHWIALWALAAVGWSASAAAGAPASADAGGPLLRIDYVLAPAAPTAAIAGQPLLGAVIAHPAPATPLDGHDRAAAGADDADEARVPEPDAPVIVVTGRKPRPAILAGVVPEIELGPEDIAGFGAGTVEELLELLAPQTTGNGPPGGRPLVLINGQRASGLDEIRNLPPEAVLRIEILPEEVALRYGRRPGNKVVNLVLQPHFRAVTAEASYGGATEGGRSIGQVRVNVARIAPSGRWLLDAGYFRESLLTEDERPLAGGLGPFRSLLPRTRRLFLGGSFARALSATTDLRLTARVEEQDGESRTGPAPPGIVADERSLPALLRTSRSHSASLGAALNGASASWIWSATGSLDLVRQRTETELATSGAPIRERIRSRSQSGALELLAFRELASLPAGPLTVSLTGRLEAFGYRNRSSLALPPGPDQLSRRTVSGQADLEIPLLDGSLAGLEGFGELSANLNLALEHVSSFGTLKTIGAGLRWAPARWLWLTLSASERDSAPDVQSLVAPTILVPNVRTYDFVTGDTVDIVRVEGGNADLRAQRTRQFTASLNVRPVQARNLIASVTYHRNRTADPILAFSLGLPEYEAAFPERFGRTADGRLARIDTRPLNLARNERDELRWGFSYFRTISPPAPAPATSGDGAQPPGADAAREAGFDLAAIRRAPATPATLQLALYHSWRLRDRLIVRDGLPAIDFLAGAPASPQGGAPQHRIELQAALYRGGFGARLSGIWQSGSRARVEDRTLSYRSLARFDLRLFADLGERRGLVARAPWLRGTRISLEVDNLLGARPRVRDETRRTPPGLQPAFLDPAGRTVRFTLRKLF